MPRESLTTTKKKRTKKKRANKPAANTPESPDSSSPANTAGPALNLQMMDIAAINPAAYNPRENLQPGDPDFDKLVRSIETYGLVEPLVFNQRSGNLVGGHQRMKVLQHLGHTQCQVSVVDLDDADEKALNIALNKIEGDWHGGRLADVLAELQAAADFDETLTGFDDLEIEHALAQAVAGLDDEDPADADQSSSIKAEYAVMITCRDETEQRRIFDQMKAAGHKCRVLSI